MRRSRGFESGGGGGGGTKATFEVVFEVEEAGLDEEEAVGRLTRGEAGEPFVLEASAVEEDEMLARCRSSPEGPPSIGRGMGYEGEPKTRPEGEVGERAD